MQTNKNTLYIVVALVLGVLVGYLFWGTRDRERSMHMMPDGTMMHDESMSMDAMMHDMMAELEGKTGDAFDQAFLSEMIVHHQGAVVMAEAVIENSKRPELIKLANDIISAQTKEIKMMQDWQKEWDAE
jgi:uncharacterized protein (DUF305 family)